MKYLFITIVMLAFSCQNKSEQAEKPQTINSEVSVSAQKNDTTASVTALPSDWICLTDKDGELIIFNSCDGGNMLLTISEKKLLLHGQQEDTEFIIKSIDESSNSTIIKTTGLTGEGSQDFIFKWIDKDKGLGKWSTTYDNPEKWHWEYTFVSAPHQKDFKLVNQPCKECWGDECDEMVDK